MKERIKSWMLVLLILGSLVESYYLIYRLPGSDSAVLSKTLYVKTDNMGPEEKVENLLYPDKMIIHMGGDKHTLFYPSSTFYNLIMNRLKGRSFESFQRRSVQDFDWDKIRSENSGIELSFGAGIPVTLLQRVMQISPDSLFEGESIDRIWIYNIKNDSKAHAIFFSTRGDIVYEAAKADLTVQDVQQHVDFGKNLTLYTSVNGEYYVPEADVPLVKVVMPAGMYTIEQMQSNLFFDAGSTRYIPEKDGSKIYTDSKRSLQVDQEQNWMSYSDPAALPDGDSTPAKDALEAVDFVNRHGGWNGTYRLAATEEGRQDRKVSFQQYYGAYPSGSYPIMSNPQLQYGVIHLELQQGTVSSYERSLMYTNEDKSEKTIVELPGGELLKQRLAQIGSSLRIIELTPAYMPALAGEKLQLHPVWRVTLSDGSELTLN
ncbi:YycH family protein [Paenibacillus sp. FSL R7-277]|uniref:YycH family regulatory protein n=1 Tax=Paenibacillus sp. FSL R7-277 TaxID=1227352 RepID=UPI0003E2C5F7|nr:two-component system activity regulator YycH [Paenibacillus sp. FSL R7-277]ETT64978.1 YycH family protein [Paenibacillus sp. FSL R7-277]